MAKANYRVNVRYEAVPFSDTYYKLNGAQQSQVNLLFLNEVNALIPQATQQNWLGINVLNSDYDDILAIINPILIRETPVPSGTSLALAAPQGTYWKITQTGHVMQYFVYLSNSSGTSATPWEMAVTHNGIVHNARMGLNYECVLI